MLRFKIALTLCLVLIAINTCTVTEPPTGPIEMEGIIVVNPNFSTWTIRKVHVFDKDGVVLGSVAPVLENGDLYWSLFLAVEENTPCTIWVELRPGNSGPVYFNQGRDDSIGSNGRYDLAVNEAQIPILTASDLRLLGKDDLHPIDANYVLVRDINLSGSEWEPIGKDGNEPFTGSFNGRHRTLHGLRLPGGSYQYIGLFGYVRGTPLKKVEIKNLNIQLGAADLYVHTVTEQSIGVVVAYAENALFEKVTVQGSLNGLAVTKTDSGNISVGGIVGNLVVTAGSSSITQSVSMLPLSVNAGVENSEDCVYTGALVGHCVLSGGSTGISIENCYSTDLTAVNAVSNAYSSGLIGYVDYDKGGNASGSVLVRESYVSGNLSAAGKNVYAGGIIAGNIDDDTTLQLVVINNTAALMNQISVSYDAGGTANVNSISAQHVSASSASNYQVNEMIFLIGGSRGSAVDGIPVARVSLSQAWFITVVGWNFRDIWKWNTTLKRPILQYQ